MGLINTKTKTIKSQGKDFLKRFSLYLKDGSSFKIHLILEDDLDAPHDHPWDFKSLLLIPYKEVIYYEDNTSMDFRHKPFTIVEREMCTKHTTSLYRIFGFKIPAITIGKYSKKKQLCSFCREAGYCLTKGQ